MVGELLSVLLLSLAIFSCKGIAEPEPEPVTLSFVLSGGQTTTALDNGKLTGTPGEPLSVANPTRTGYKFTGWTPPLPSIFPPTNTTYTANWNPITYKVAFNANGGSGTMESQTLTYDKSESLSENKFTNDGYGFIGWSLSAGGEKKYDDKSSVQNLSSVENATVTLYAMWGRPYKVEHYQENIADSGYTKIETENKAGGEGEKTEAVAKVYEGFNCVGTDNSTDEDTITQETISADGSTVISVYYKRKVATITLNLDGGSITGATSFTGKYGASIGTVPDPTKDGYIFGGWRLLQGETETEAEIPDTFPDSDRTYKADWSGYTYTVRFDANGGTGVMADQEFISSESKSLSKNLFTRGSDYTFIGWATSPDSPVEFSDEQEVKTVSKTAGVIILYAKWLKDGDHQIKYNLNGGANNSGNRDTYNENDSLAVALLSPEKEGYTFAGWYSDEDFTGSAVTEIPADSKTDLEFWAKWTPNTYTVTLQKNDGTSSVVTQTFTYGTEQALESVTRQGYSFTHWVLSTDESKTFTENQVVLNLTAENGGNVVLVAQWTPATVNYTVIHWWENANDTDYSKLSVQTKSGLTGSLTEATEYTTGTVSTKIYCIGTDKSTSSSAITQKTIAADGSTEVNIYYKRRTFTITLYVDGVKFGTYSGKYYSYVPAAASTKPTKTGYVFVGWTESEGGTDTVSLDRFTKNQTLYAKWRENEYYKYMKQAGEWAVPYDYTSPCEPSDGFYMYHTLGVFPQTIKASSVTITSTTEEYCGETYYKGSDNCWYVKVKSVNNSSSAIFSDGTKVVKNAEYYFKVEPIKWRELASVNGSYLLFSENVLAISQFAKFSSNYKNSVIRAYINGLSYSGGSYLNKGFLQLAFTETQQADIIAKTVKNDVASTNCGDGVDKSSYICDDTIDKIFLLSASEIVNLYYGFNESYNATDPARNKQRTDYAIANSDVYNYWWLRSPCTNASSGYGYAYGINVNDNGKVWKSGVDSGNGVVPALWYKP